MHHMTEIFEPRDMLPVSRSPKAEYPLYTIKAKRPGFFRRAFGLGWDVRVFGITHVYSATHRSGGYHPGMFITENRAEAEDEVKERWARDAHPLVVCIKALTDPQMIRRRKQWAVQQKEDFWNTDKKILWGRSDIIVGVAAGLAIALALNG
jgi:hypothetical protein